MSKPLNIAVVGSTIPPVMGGLEVYTFELARQLSKRGHRVFLIGYGHYRGLALQPHENIEGVEVFRLPSNERAILGSKFWYFQKVAAKLKEINQQFPLALIHANCVIPAGLGACVFKFKNPGVPLVVTSHGYEVLVRPRQFIYGFLARQVFRRTDLVIGVSVEVARASVAAGANPAKVVNWSNPVDTSRFNPALSGLKIRKKYSLADDEVVILSLRRLHPKTGVQYLVAAAPQIVRKVKKIKFLIVGEGILKEKLIRQVKETGLEKEFIFTGSLPNDEVPDYIAAADLAVFPSLAEATSIACLEVMACGLPVVASDVGGLPEIIEHGYNGLLVNFPKNVSDYSDFGLAPEVIGQLASRIIELAGDLPLRKKMGRQAAEKVKNNFGWDNYLNKLLLLYEGLIYGTST